MKDNIIKDELKNQFAKKYLAYALSTITQRALPDLRDGLKPVHRRLIYAMYLLNLSPKSQFKKSARVVGDVIGKFHPHGDQSVYDALVRLAQDFSTRYPLILGQGNFGNVDGDNPAAMRYTETKLTEISQSMLDDIDFETVNFIKTYDGELEEPEILPSKFPNILANGSSGIAVGMATSIPPHNLEEICKALIALNNDPSISINELIKIIPGPDFPTGGILNNNKKEILNAYKTGKGFFELKARHKIEDLGRGMYQIVIFEIPYQVNKSKLIEKIASLIINKQNKLLDHVSDESDEKIRIVLRPKNRNVDPQVLLNSLYDQTELKIKFFINMNVLNSKRQPKIMSLKEVLQDFLKHRYVILNKKIIFQLKKIKSRLEILKGFLIVYSNLNKIIKIIRFSNDPKKELIRKFRFSNIQVDAILDMKLRNLKKIEENEIKQEFKNLEDEKRKLSKIFSSKILQKKELNTEFESIILEFGNNSKFGNRKTSLEIFKEVSDEEIESSLQVIDNVNISLFNQSLIKARKNHIKFEKNYTSENNLIATLNCKSNDDLCFVSNFGKSFILNASKLKFGSTKGYPISSHLKLKENEIIVDFFIYKEKLNILLYTKNGYGFFIQSKDLHTLKKSGKKIFKVKSSDSLSGMSCATEDSKFCVFLQEKNLERKILISDLTEIPSQTKGSGIRLCKINDFNLINVIFANSKYEIQNIFDEKFPILSGKSYTNTIGSAGKPSKLDFLNLNRGFANNLKVVHGK